MNHEEINGSRIPSEKTEEEIPQTRNIDEIISELAHNRPQIVSFLRKRGVSENIAEDMAQEAFIRAQKAAPNFKGLGPTLNWHSTIAWNIYIDTVMPNNKRKIILQQESTGKSRPNEKNNELDINMSDGSSDSLKQLISKEEVTRIQTAIGSLSKKLKSVMTLHVEGMSSEEIAHTLKISQGSVRNSIHLARKKLSQVLDLKRK